MTLRRTPTILRLRYWADKIPRWMTHVPSLSKKEVLDLVSSYDQIIDLLTAKGTGDFYFCNLSGWSDVWNLNNVGWASTINLAYAKAAETAKSCGETQVIVEGASGRVVLTVYPDGSAEFNPNLEEYDPDHS